MPAESAITCPVCLGPTASLKAYQPPIVVFLLVYIVWNTDHVVACPECMRKHLWKRMGQSLFAANVLFPIPAVGITGYLLATYTKGHSDNALAESHRMTDDDVAAHQFAGQVVKKSNPKEWLILFAIIAVIASIWAVGFWMR